MNIEDIVKRAKEKIIKNGGIDPVLLVEFEDGEEMQVLVASMPDGPKAQEQMFFSLGRQLGQARATSYPSDVVFVSEAWTSETRGGKAVYERPALDPQKKEVMIISYLKISPAPERKNAQLHLSHYIYEIIRYEGGVDLLELDHSDAKVQHSLPSAFLAGIKSSPFSDEAIHDYLSRLN